MVPLPTSSVASATSDFRQDLNLLGKRLILLGKHLQRLEQAATSAIVSVSCKDSMLRCHAKPLSRRACGDVFCWNALEPNNESKEMKIITTERDNSTNWTTAKSTQTSSYANCQGPGVLHFFSSIPLVRPEVGLSSHVSRLFPLCFSLMFFHLSLSLKHSLFPQ